MINFKYTFVCVKRSQKQQNCTHFCTHSKKAVSSSKSATKSETGEIYAQIVLNGGRFRLSTGIKLPSEWLVRGTIVQTTDSTANERLQAQQNLNKFAERLDAVGEVKSITDIKSRLQQTKSNSFNVSSCFSSHIDALKQRKVADSTIKRFTCVQGKWMKFEAKQKHTYTLDEISTDTLRAFEAYLSDEVCTRGRKTMRDKKSTNSVAKYIHTLKAVCNAHGVSVRYSATENYTQTPYYLTLDELQIIKQHQAQTHRERIYQSFFVLQCKTGLRVGDLSNLNENNVQTSDGVTMIVTTSSKTNTTTSVPIATADEFNDIREQVKQLSTFKGFNLSAYNKHIKQLFIACKLDRLVTIKQGRKAEFKHLYEVASSHIARRTFVGNLYEKGIDRAIITSMSGHTQDSKSLNRYFAVSQAQKVQAVKIFD